MRINRVQVVMQKVVVITGGSSGIGKAIGEYLIEKNYSVYGTSRTPERYTDTKFPLVALEVTNLESIKSAIQTILAKEHRIDVLINNAGVGITGALEEVPLEEMRANFETNFFGPLQVTNAVLPSMRKNKNGVIINITSIAAYMGLPYRGIYSASKGALQLVTEAYRIELKPFNIKITTLAPGDFATNIAQGRYHAPLVEKSPYFTSYKNTLETMNNDVEEGKNPKLLAHEVYKIIERNNLKVHYRVGAFMQKFSVVLKRILPDTIFEKLLTKHYKL